MLVSAVQEKTADAPLAFDVSDPAFRRNPYPRYAELRDSPLLHRGMGGLWVLTRHADVQAVLRDSRMSSHPRHIPPERLAARGRGAIGEGLGMLGDQAQLEIMLVADAPDHTRLRRLATKAFTPRAVERLRPRITELVDLFLDQAIERREFDVMSGLAEPLPVMVICDLLGVPLADQEQFKPWSSTIARVIDPDVDASMFPQALPAIVGFVQYFAGLIEERRSDPGDDLLSALIAAETDGDTLSQQELFAMIILLFIAGHETTTNLIGNGTLALARHADAFGALRADPSLVVAGTEELLRFDSPVQATVRTATCDLEINGLLLERGEGVVCSLAAANRDPRYVADPDRLDLGRGASTHLSFGNGMHHCLGAPLARLEGQIVFARLAQRCASLELANPDPPYRDHFVLRGLSALPVALTPA